MPEVPEELWPQDLLDQALQTAGSICCRAGQARVQRVYIGSLLSCFPGHAEWYPKEYIGTVYYGLHEANNLSAKPHWYTGWFEDAKAFSAFDFYRDHMDFIIRMNIYFAGCPLEVVTGERKDWVVRGKAQAQG